MVHINRVAMEEKMTQVPIRFIVGELTEDDVQALMKGQSVICKMILPPDDVRLFQYKEGDSIEAESEHGNRQWCTISDLERVENEDGVIIILTVVKKTS